jgi:hypothetical protein
MTQQPTDNPFMSKLRDLSQGASQEERIAVCEAHVTTDTSEEDWKKNHTSPKALWTPFGVIERNFTGNAHLRKKSTMGQASFDVEDPQSPRKCCSFGCFSSQPQWVHVLLITISCAVILSTIGVGLSVLLR